MCLSSHCSWVMVMAIRDKGCCYENVSLKLMVFLFSNGAWEKCCHFYIILCNELVKTFHECWITKGEVQLLSKDSLCQHVGEEFH